MRNVLIGASVLLTVFIVVGLMQKKQPPTVATLRTVETKPQPKSQPSPAIQTPVVEAVPSKTMMPEPVLITVAQDASVIADEKLRRFVGRNAVFSRDKVLYFEWHGGPQDKMDGIVVSDLETKDKRYVVRLKSTQGESMLHRQVFIIPRNYTYEVEISNE